jgi:hypothetical protein
VNVTKKNDRRRERIERKNRAKENLVINSIDVQFGFFSHGEQCFDPFCPTETQEDISEEKERVNKCGGVHASKKSIRFLCH